MLWFLVVSLLFDISLYIMNFKLLIHIIKALWKKTFSRFQTLINCNVQTLAHNQSTIKAHVFIVDILSSEMVVFTPENPQTLTGEFRRLIEKMKIKIWIEKNLMNVEKKFRAIYWCWFEGGRGTSNYVNLIFNFR